jgi:hypothetical protein
MTTVFGSRSWVIWWAALTATIFLQDWLRGLSKFFRNTDVFTPTIPPFNFAAVLNTWIDSAAEYIRTVVKFNPNQVIASVGPISIGNWVFALLFGIVILAVAAVFYVRALGTSGLLDDIFALILLYFVIRIEAHLITIAKFQLLSSAGKTLLDNPAISFGIVLILLLVLAFAGEGFRDPRSFWRGLIEGLIVAIFLFPTQAAAAVAAGLDALAGFGRLIQTNVTVGVVWGLVGVIMAIWQLYSRGGGGARAARPAASGGKK